MPKGTEKEHIKTLKSLGDKMSEMLSWKKVFARGIVRGIGIAIGATIIAAHSFLNTRGPGRYR